LCTEQKNGAIDSGALSEANDHRFIAIENKGRVAVEELRKVIEKMSEW
jgi:hypothetical protein